MESNETPDHDDCFYKFKRFLYSGNEDNGPHGNQLNVTKLNSKSLFRLLDMNQGDRVIQEIRQISNDYKYVDHVPLVYALAVCCRSSHLKTKTEAYSLVNSICENPRSLLDFVKCCKYVSNSKKNERMGFMTQKTVENQISLESFKNGACDEVSQNTARRLGTTSSANLAKPLLRMRKNSSQSANIKAQAPNESQMSLLELSELSRNQKAIKGSMDTLVIRSIEGKSIGSSTHRPLSSRTCSSFKTIENEGTRLPPIDFDLDSENLNTFEKSMVMSSAELKVISDNVRERIRSARLVSEAFESNSFDLIASKFSFNDKAYARPTSSILNQLQPENKLHIRKTSLASNDKEQIFGLTDAITVKTRNSNCLPPINPVEKPKSLVGNENEKTPRTKSSKSQTASLNSVSHQCAHQPHVSERNSALARIMQEKQLSNEHTSDTKQQGQIESLHTLTVTSESFLTTVTQENRPNSNSCGQTEKPIEFQDNIELNPRISSSYAQSSAGLVRHAGWGRAHRRAIADWYTSKDPKALVKLITKQRKHGKWSHRDLICLSHPKSDDFSMNIVLKYIVKGLPAAREYYMTTKSNKTVVADDAIEPVPVQSTDISSQHASSDDGLIKTDGVSCKSDDQVEFVYSYLNGYEELKRTDDESHACKLIDEFNFELEHLPVRFAKAKGILRKLMVNSSTRTILRKLNDLSSKDVFSRSDDDNTDYLQFACDRLKNDENTSGLKFYDILYFWLTYRAEHNRRTNWHADARLLDAFNVALNRSLHNTKPSGKNLCVIVNFKWKSKPLTTYLGLIRPFDLAIGMCLMHLHVESSCCIYNYTNKLISIAVQRPEMGFADIHKLVYDSSQGHVSSYLSAFDEVLNTSSLEIDAFLIYTNTKTSVSCQTTNMANFLSEYSRKSNRPNVKLVVVSFSTKQPNDCQTVNNVAKENNRILEINYFDELVPQLIQNFICDKF